MTSASGTASGSVSGTPSMLRGIIRAYRQLHWALKRYYRRRARRPLTPEQEVNRLMRQIREREDLVRRLTGRW